MVSTPAVDILKRCSVEGKENGASKAVLFANLKATVSTAQLEMALEELLSKGQLVKVRRDRYIVDENLQKKTPSDALHAPSSGLAGHVKRFKANHKISLIKV